MKNVGTISCFLSLLLAWPGFAQQKMAEANLKADELLKNYRIHENIPGMSVTITLNDSIIYSKGFGYSNLEKKTPVNPAGTRFRMASITKTMTAITLARLAEMGKVEFKKSVYFYLDSLPKMRFDFTIEEVGGHLSGIRRYTPSEKYTCDNTYSRKDFYPVFSTEKLLFKPSTKFQYSNYGYKLLGVLIEKITGQSVVENHKKYVIDKVGLRNTFPETRIPDSLTASFYSIQNRKLAVAPCLDCTFKYASGCYLSTSEDLAKLGNAYLFPDRVLKKETLTDLIKSKTLKDGSKTHYGFGFAIHTDFYNHLYYGHTGGYDNARSSLAIYPQHRLVIAILINRSVEDIDSLTAEIANNYIVQLNKPNK
jgi:serine beta-lactamase-like protein LACTB